MASTPTNRQLAIVGIRVNRIVRIRINGAGNVGGELVVLLHELIEDRRTHNDVLRLFHQVHHLVSAFQRDDELVGIAHVAEKNHVVNVVDETWLNQCVQPFKNWPTERCHP